MNISIFIRTRQAFFIARFSLAAIAPLLFARVLSLAQVDNTLGPMTQVRSSRRLEPRLCLPYARTPASAYGSILRVGLLCQLLRSISHVDFLTACACAAVAEGLASGRIPPEETV